MSIFTIQKEDKTKTSKPCANGTIIISDLQTFFAKNDADHAIYSLMEVLERIHIQPKQIGMAKKANCKFTSVLLQTRKREMERIVNHRYVVRFLRSLLTICKALDDRGSIQGLQDFIEFWQVSIALFCGSDCRVYFDYDAVQYPLFGEEV